MPLPGLDYNLSHVFVASMEVFFSYLFPFKYMEGTTERRLSREANTGRTAANTVLKMQFACNLMSLWDSPGVWEERSTSDNNMTVPRGPLTSLPLI